MFKKRQSKGTVRKPCGEDSESDHEDGIDLTSVSDLKYEQQLRKKSKGMVIDGLDPSGKGKGDRDFASKKTIESIMTNQFSVQVENGFSGTNHETLMEKYVEEKLGINKPSAVEPVRDTLQDSLYRLPDHLKVSSSKSSGSEEIGILGSSSGIMEVALPMKFKLANIEATDAARRSLQDHRPSAATGGSIGFRYKPPVTIVSDLAATSAAVAEPATVAVPTVSSVAESVAAAAAEQVKQTAGVPKRHDDLFFNKYAKGAQARRR